MILTVQGTPEEIIQFARVLEHGKKVTVDGNLLGMVKSGLYIEAIKFHRDSTGCGLAEAKTYVDCIRKTHGV